NEALDQSLRNRLAPVEEIPSLRGMAQIGAVETPESIVSAARVVAGMRASFRACYNRALTQNPEVTGSVKVSASIEPGGSVTTAKATPKGALPAALVACVEARVRAAQFEPASDSKPARVAFTVQFTSE
ncbi:MAG TPA: AgmX/PglI C-terminal domain-containing protein, partial [Polyangiaceae bacterium]|nr:AgmX/PglI C-terminal domain-containing protein [Polyangiaceae bacterium]